MTLVFPKAVESGRRHGASGPRRSDPVLTRRVVLHALVWPTFPEASTHGLIGCFWGAGGALDS